MSSHQTSRDTPAKTAYHHGDLALALVQAAQQLIELGGGARLSLREAARVAGVSVAAPYRHFADREALLAAVLAEGFRELAAATDAARQAAPGPMEGVLAVGMAYVRFAAGHPQTYRMMFGAECDKAAYPELKEAGQQAFGVLVSAVSACKAGGFIGPEADVAQIVLAGWSLSHGLASLHADGMLEGNLPGGLEPTAAALFGMLLRGARP
ncbi:TetR/AcrR family transcriptional regulator [Ramlibacter sp.]|uniref:TetR/AcrR family transcriptional regulator n=1 Tax=Ramlibacter sp. TaxID=1917967 RepID=UPI0018057A04|nr:TetR/AcrR family transcriptional regulator [Ramlibacter sp.]MBA2675232.1 TetR/AcrR family transcriptional regulator [Ramlibacter sp.]